MKKKYYKETSKNVLIFLVNSPCYIHNGANSFYAELVGLSDLSVEEENYEFKKIRKRTQIGLGKERILCVLDFTHQCTSYHNQPSKVEKIKN